MRTLFITRHGKAAPHGKGGDIDRPLEDGGKKDAARMADRLKRMASVPQELLSSPALRARMTAGSMIEVWGWDEAHFRTAELLYPGDPEEILLWSASFSNDTEKVMLIGHQPWAAQLIELLTGAPPNGMPPCAIARCDFEVNDWNAVVRGSGHLKWVIHPEQH